MEARRRVKLTLRLPPQLHRRMVGWSRAQDRSIQKALERMIEQALAEKPAD